MRSLASGRRAVSVLIEKLNALSSANVPKSETGMVTAGMRVVRQSWRKRKMTSTTRQIASASVFRTSLIDSWTNIVASNAIVVANAWREIRFREAQPSRRLTCPWRRVLSEFGVCCAGRRTPMPIAVLPSNFRFVE